MLNNIPLKIIRRAKKEIDFWNFWRDLTFEQKTLWKLQHKAYSNLNLTPTSETCSQNVIKEAEKVHEERWNYYSNALRREVIYTFECAISTLQKSNSQIDYLEIGSAQGISMSFIGSMLKELSCLGDLISIDPYFDSGYQEGAKGVWNKNIQVEINKTTRDKALKLYESLKLGVELIEKPSVIGLKELLSQSRKFHLIYIDGSHEGLIPALDFGLSCQLLHEGGIIMLDDHHWPDVKAIKCLCDKHCKKIDESWKVAAYQIKIQDF